MNEKKKQSSFYYAFRLLPKNKRFAMSVFYRFSHLSDEIVDNPNKSAETKKTEFEKWENDFKNALNSKSNNTLLTQVAEIINEYSIPINYFFELLDGIKSDLNFTQPKNFNELESYAYKVASTVGLITIHIFGFKNKNAENFAINLGKALQITNIIRDVKKDFETKRIYIPKTLFAKTNYSIEKLRKNSADNSFINLMKETDDFAENFYQKANEYFPKADYKTLYPAVAMGEIYYKLLENLRKKNYDIFNNTFSVPKSLGFLIAVKHILKRNLFL